MNTTYIRSLCIIIMLIVNVLSIQAQTDKGNDSSKKDEVFMIVEEMPEFPGGEEARIQFMEKNIKYPRKAKENNIQGKVIVGFIVEPDGSISNIKIVRSVHPLLDAEAMRITRSMPKWKPGKQRGKTIRVQFTMPITFSLEYK